MSGERARTCFLSQLIHANSCRLGVTAQQLRCFQMSDWDLETLGTHKGFPDHSEDNACHHPYYPNQEINILGDTKGNRRETWQTDDQNQNDSSDSQRKGWKCPVIIPFLWHPFITQYPFSYQGTQHAVDQINNIKWNGMAVTTALEITNLY